MDHRLTRRDFLRGAAIAGGSAALLGPRIPEAFAGPRPKRIRGGSILDLPASASPIDHVVVIMMENRSFDHYLGWLGTDEAYREAGRARYSRFRVKADNSRVYRAP